MAPLEKLSGVVAGFAFIVSGDAAESKLRGLLAKNFIVEVLKTDYVDRFEDAKLVSILLKSAGKLFSCA